MSEEIGNIRGIRGEVHVEWQIPEFLSLSREYYDSPVFCLSDSRWFLRIYPNDPDCPDHVGLFLGRDDDGSPKTVYASFGIKRADGVEEKYTDTIKLPEEVSKNKVFGDNRFISKSDLTQRKSHLMPSNALTVTCTLTDGVGHPTEGEKVQKENKGSQTDAAEKETDSEYNTLQKLQKDFENLFKNGEDCDVTIKVQNKEFPAHKSILRSRSPVFKSMFSHETQENLSGVVVIDDCDPETFPDFLNYLYSGCIKHINEKNVCHLFTASDKYQVDELKEECAKFMKSHLSVDTFCDFMTLFLMHSVQELIDSATDFFCSNAVEVGKTVKWQIFLKENLTVGNELFLKSLSR